jgi:cellulose synthase/poly-beta-1,6-N-acetylglucosamine synthase-like glycosyltransferase
MIFLTYLFWLCLGTLLYPYTIYPLILFILNKIIPKHSLPHRDRDIEWPSITLLVPAYNEEGIIEHKIRNCLALDYPFELFNVWIASDGSSDKTNEIVKRYASSDNRVVLLEFPRTGKSGIINLAMENIKSDIVVFTDANVMLEKNVLKELATNFSDPNIGCVGAKLIRHNPNDTVSGRGETLYWSYETIIKKMEGNLGYMSGASGTAYAIKKDLFDPLNSNTINDDFEISMEIVKKGFRCVYEEKAISYEEVAPSVEGEFMRHIRDGAGHYIAILHLAGLLNPFLGLRSFIFWSHRILRWLAPFILILFLITNILLAHVVFYGIFLMIHFLFYLLALLGWLIVKRRYLPFYFHMPFYFCNLNAALLIGFFKAVTGKQQTKWESTARS